MAATIFAAGLLCAGAALGADVLETVAGNGRSGHDGDGASALAASFVRPQALVVDAAGNLYIADRPAADDSADAADASAPGRLRKLDAATGTISTFADRARPGGLGD